MLLTEKEANTKLCPQHIAKCSGSQCMAWRWADPERFTPYFFHDAEDKNATEEPPRPASVPADWVFVPCDDDAAHWREPDEQHAKRHQHWLSYRRGYCGLAGKPPAPEGEGGE